MPIPGSIAARGGIWVRLLVGLAVIFACLAVAWMLLLPSAVARYVRDRTGFGVEIQSLYANPFTGNVAIRGLVVTNPGGFPRKEFFEVREFRANADLFSLFTRHPVVEDAVLDVSQVTIVRDARGQLNAARFKDGFSTPSGAPAPPREAPPAQAAAPDGRGFLIRRLVVRCDRVLIADYTGPKPQVKEINLHFNHVYENVTDARQLMAPIGEILVPIGIALDEIAPGTGSAARSLGDAVKETGRRVKGLWEALEKSLKK